MRAATNECEVEPVPREEMAADPSGLVHGGFIFSAADYCAMCAVNHPNVALSKAKSRFLRPSRVGKRPRFVGCVVEPSERKPVVPVEASNAQRVAFEASFQCVIPACHVLSLVPRLPWHANLKKRYV